MFGIVSRYSSVELVIALELTDIRFVQSSMLWYRLEDVGECDFVTFLGFASRLPFQGGESLRLSETKPIPEQAFIATSPQRAFEKSPHYFCLLESNSDT
jgi:hypothetical protein